MIRRDPSRSPGWCGIARIFGATLATALAIPVQATICKYSDAEGNIVYSNVAQAKGLHKLSCDIVEDSPRRTGGAGAKPSATPPGFPRVEPETQRSRDEMRRKVLGDELASEEKLLAEARDAYGNGAPSPMPDERNVEALRKEIATTR